MARLPVVVQTSLGFRLVSPELRELSRSLSASWFKRFLKVDFPSALPSCFAGLRVAMTLAVIAAIIAEFVSSSSGLGFIITNAGTEGSVSLSIAAIEVLAMLGFVLYEIVALIERLVVPWERDGT